MPPSWSGARHPASNGGAHDHGGVAHGFLLSGHMHVPPIPKLPYAPLWPIEGVPLGLWHALKGVRHRSLVSLANTRPARICKKIMHRLWAYFHARRAFTMAAFNLLVQGYGL
jgi:hypothetical protein